MDVVFYIEIGGSFGEREHALGFARGIARAGYRPRFVVSPRVEEHIRLAGFEPEVFSVPEQGVEIVRKIRPAMSIGCELFNLSHVSVQGLIETGRPVGTLDGTSVSLEINTDPFQDPQLVRPLVLPDRYYAFRPCPVNDPGADRDDAFHWPLFPDAARAEKDERHYGSLGLDPARRTVLFAVAPWAVKAARMLRLQPYYQRVFARVVAALCAYGEPVDLLLVSRGGRGRGRKGPVEIHGSDLVPYDVYDHILRSCDAIVTDNIIQTSVSKAVVMGTPHLVIQNLASVEMPFPCNIFPVRVLFPEEREYAQVVEVAEYGDGSDVREKLSLVLERGYADSARRQRRQDYVARLSRLAEPGAILEGILGPAEESAPEA